MSLIKEAIFSHAVALHQSGRMRNTIHIAHRTVFILNFDKTILLKFTLPEKEIPFKGEVNFNSSDYDSDAFEEKDGRIIFTQTSGDYVRTKSCGTTEKRFADVESLWDKFWPDIIRPFNMILLNKNILSLLDEGLSHIEFLSAEGKITISQRDIYTGAVIRIEKTTTGFGISSDQISGEWGPFGMRTYDFIALFSFCDEIKITFSSRPFFIATGDRFNMSAIIAHCLYDELGIVTTIAEEASNGRQEQKRRRRRRRK